VPDVYRRQHVGFEVHGRVHHAPAGAAVAHAAALAREGDELGVTTLAALQVQAAVLRDAAGEKPLELVSHEVGKSSVRFHLLVERGPVGGDRLVERAVLWTVALVAVATAGRRRVETRRAVRRVSGVVHTPPTGRGVPQTAGRASAACGGVGTGGHGVRAVAASGRLIDSPKAFKRQRTRRLCRMSLGKIGSTSPTVSTGSL
jgi:hypothetical protein